MGKMKVILSTVIGGGGVAGVQTVTGDGVDNTSPANPVVSFPDQSEIQAIRPLKTVNNESLEGTGNINIEAGGAVNSVTGDGVGGTAEDVVLSFPNADEVDDSSTTNKFLTQTEKDKITQNESFIALLQNNKADKDEVILVSSDGSKATSGKVDFAVYNNDGKFLLYAIDTEITSYNELSVIQIEKKGARIVYEKGDGAGQSVEVNYIESNTNGVEVSSTSGKGAKYNNITSYSSIDWNDSNYQDHLAPIKTIKENTLNSTEVGEPTGSTGIGNIVEISQANYDAAELAGTLVSTTLYLIPS